MNAFPLEMRFAVKAWTDGRQLHEADHETGYSLLVINRPGQQRMNLARFRRGRGKPWDSSFSMLYTCTLDRRIRLEVWCNVLWLVLNSPFDVTCT